MGIELENIFVKRYRRSSQDDRHHHGRPLSGNRQLVGAKDAFGERAGTKRIENPPPLPQRKRSRLFQVQPTCQTPRNTAQPRSPLSHLQEKFTLKASRHRS